MNACSRARNVLFPIAMVFILIFITACTNTPSSPNRNAESPIERNMKEFYTKLGGKGQLGDFLSPVLQDGDLYYQFTEKVVMVFDPKAITLKQYYLYPVGLEMGFNEPAEPMPADPEAVYVNGFVVWPEALNIYNKWGRMCKPISALHYNESAKRFEQYFDCFGVYRNEDEPVGTVHLLDYGIWKCGKACGTYPTNITSSIPQQIFPETPNKQELVDAEDIIISASNRIGRAVTGFPLTATYLSEDGAQYLKIYENVVLAVDRSKPSRAYVLAITRSLNMRPDKAKAEVKEKGARFVPVNGKLGYTVRSYFVNFLALHGGLETSGNPTTNEFALNTSVLRQCFENLCLDYHKKAADGLKVRPATLGYIYRELYYREEPDEPAIVAVNSNITIHPWETLALISSDEEQEIGAAIYENFVAVPDVQVILRVRMPDETWVEYGPQATDKNGQTVFHLDPISAANSTMILYQVCLFGIDEEKTFCVMEDFTIWGNP